MFHNDITYHLHDSCFEECVCLFIMHNLHEICFKNCATTIFIHRNVSKLCNAAKENFPSPNGLAAGW